MTRMNPATLTAAKELLDQHKKNTTSVQRKQNLDLLWGVLEDLRKAGAVRFNLADVGKKLESLGGPITQSLRNKKGTPFREVICLYESGFKSCIPESELSGIERALATVTNASAKHVLREAAVTAKAVAKERDQLKTALMEMSVSPPSRQNSALASTPVVPDWIFEAIRSNLDPSRLMERGVSMADDGCLQNERQVALLGPDFVGAINEMLALHGKPPLDLRQP